MKINKTIKVLIFFVFTLLLSCSGDDPANVIYNINEESSLVKNYEKVLRNQEVVFSLIGENNADYTEFATFYVDGVAIEGNVFSSSIEGVFSVYAGYDLAGTITTTNTTSVEVFIPKRKVLIEDYTANWCGPCVRIATGIRKVREQSEDVVIVSIHGNSIVTATDPLAIPDGMFLKNYFEVPYYPTGIINRDEFWEWELPDFEFIISHPIAFAGTEVNTSISINSQFVATDLMVEIKVISETNITSKKIVIFLLEDGILLDQANGYYNYQPDSEWYQMGDPIIDYEHNDVLRVSITDPLGDAIPDIAALEERSINYTLTIPEDYNSSNLSIVAMVVNEDDTVINAQFAGVNENKSYE